MEALILVATHGGPTMFARINDAGAGSWTGTAMSVHPLRRTDQACQRQEADHAQGAIAWLAKEVPKSEHSMKQVQASAEAVLLGGLQTG
jgi:hypothetical protein